jgi:hypothetical protein
MIIYVCRDQAMIIYVCRDQAMIIYVCRDQAMIIYVKLPFNHISSFWEKKIFYLFSDRVLC